MNERVRRSAGGIAGPGHYDLERARRHNELMRERGERLPHPGLEPLAPCGSALYGMDYFYAEIERRTDGAPSSNAPSDDALSGGAPSDVAPPSGGGSGGGAPSAGEPSAGAPSASASNSEGSSEAAPNAAAPSTTAPSTGAPSTSTSGSAAAAASNREPDLPGIVYGMKTYGKGKSYQLNLDLAHLKVKLCTCGAKGTKPHRLWPAAKTCEHGIIKRALEEKGRNVRNKVKL